MVTINSNTYALQRTQIGDMLMLLKNGVPVMSVPEHLYEDFVQLLVHAGAAARFLNENPPKDDDEKKVNILSATKPEEGKGKIL